MNAHRLQAIAQTQKYYLLDIKPGMMLEIHEKIGEGNSQRIWKFKGIVLQVRKPGHADGTFTIRGKTSGVSIEKIYPLSFVGFDHVYLLDVYKIARARLYYLRDKIGKDAKMKSLITAEQRGADLLAAAKKAIGIVEEVGEEKPEENTEKAKKKAKAKAEKAEKKEQKAQKKAQKAEKAEKKEEPVEQTESAPTEVEAPVATESVEAEAPTAETQPEEAVVEPVAEEAVAEEAVAEEAPAEVEAPAENSPDVSEETAK